MVLGYTGTVEGRGGLHRDRVGMVLENVGLVVVVGYIVKGQGLC